MAKFEIKPFLAKKAGLPREFEADVLRESEKARMIKHPETGADCWVAKSQTVNFIDGSSRSPRDEHEAIHGFDEPASISVGEVEKLRARIRELEADLNRLAARTERPSRDGYISREAFYELVECLKSLKEDGVPREDAPNCLEYDSDSDIPSPVVMNKALDRVYGRASDSKVSNFMSELRRA